MILLDTHALLWFVAEPEQLSRAARREIDKHAAKRELLVSEISWWEIAMLVKKGRLELDRPVRQWLGEVAELDTLQAAGITPAIAATAAELPKELADPADRIICATAREWACALISKDERLATAKAVKVIW